MKSTENQEEKNERQELEINRGVELMLRRRGKKEKPRYGIYIQKKFSFLSKNFNFILEFSWGIDANPKE